MQASSQNPDHHCGLENWSLPLGEGPHIPHPNSGCVNAAKNPTFVSAETFGHSFKIHPVMNHPSCSPAGKESSLKVRPLVMEPYVQQLHVLKKPQFVLRVRNSGEVFYFLMKGTVKVGALFLFPLTSSCHIDVDMMAGAMAATLLSQERS